MNIVKNQKATVWQEIKDEKKVITRCISTYEGKDEDENAKYSSWICRFVGDAYKKAKKLDDKDRIVLTNAKVEARYDSEKKRDYCTVTVFDFDYDEEEVTPKSKKL